MHRIKTALALFVLLTLIVPPFACLGQRNVLRTTTDHEYVINWREVDRTLTDSHGKTLIRPDFEGAIFKSETDLLPVWSIRLQQPLSNAVEVELINPVYSPITVTRSNAYTLQSADPGADVVPAILYSTIRKQTYAIVSLVPLRRNPVTGVLEKLERFDLKLHQVAGRPLKKGNQQLSQRRASDNSVLSTGNWYKIAVGKEGIFKIDKSFLESMGINTASLDPSKLGVFGNGGGMLPESNDEFRHTDLQENAIWIQGEGDGSFDNGDYILFYGQSPDRWRLDTISGRFKQDVNVYSDRTFYFLTTDRGTGKRVQNRASSAASSTVQVNSFDDYAFREDELTSLLESGRQWYGDAFDAFVNNRKYSFSFPNRITTEDVWIESNVVGRSSGSSMSFQIDVNSQSALTMPLGTIVIGFDRLYATSNTQDDSLQVSGDQIDVDCSFSGDANGKGWLNYIRLNVRRELRYQGSQLRFRDSRSAAPGFVPEFSVDGADANMRIWDVSNAVEVVEQSAALSGSQMEFKIEQDTLRQYIAFENGDAFASSDIDFIDKIPNQDLRGESAKYPDMIIVSPPVFLTWAEELAQLHRDEDNLSVLVANTEQVFNEFGSGSADPTAIRDFVKMFYDKAGGDESLLPRYLQLFGDGSFDYKNIAFDASINTNFVPTFQSPNSTHPIFSYTSDDYFGFLDSGEGGNMSLDEIGIDIAIGRLVVKNSSEAAAAVQKIRHYRSSESLGSWRNTLCFIADDEDGNLHIRDANEVADQVAAANPAYNVDKIYLDAYQQVSGSGGERYPDVNQAIDNRIFAGTMMMNYVGHGSETSWAKERVLGIGDVTSWDNFDMLPLFVTATCSFSRYDNPEETSAGEHLFLNPGGGAIALVTTVRLVFSYANRQINEEFMDGAFTDFDGRKPTLGEAVMRAKNNLAASSSDGDNNRKFTLLGDPALTLVYPEHNVVTTAINGNPAGGTPDTLKALQKVTIEGEIRDASGDLISNYNGLVYPTIYDKESTITTLSNDPSASPHYNFKLQKNIIYRGKASVSNGQFTYTFIVPKDITYNFGKGKISYYAENGLVDAAGFDSSAIVGGTADSVLADDGGPDVRIFMNDESFAFGGITNENPVMLVKLEDESGINTVGNGIGHDITAVFDEDDQNAITLNDFYEAELDNYQAGEVRYLLSDLEPGRYGVRVKAWDVHNNSGEGYTEFIVSESADLALDRVLNYPNPFTTHTNFMFEHNRPGDVLSVKVEIFTVSGKLIRTLSGDVVTDGFRVDSFEWDGLDEYGDNIGRGVYVYKVSVRSLSDNSRAQEFEKLVLLR